MRKSLFLLIVGWLVIGKAVSQTNSIDSLKQLLTIYKQEDTTKVNILNSLSHHYRYIDFHQSLDYAERAGKIAEGLSFLKGVAAAHYKKAYCHWALGDNELSIDLALRAIDLAEKEALPEVLAESYRILAMDYRDQQVLDKATGYINQAEKLAVDTKNWDLLSRVYNTAGLIEFDKKNFDSSLVLFNKALLVTETHNTSIFQVCQILSNIGECNLESKPDLAFTYFNRALVMAKEVNNLRAEAGILCDLGRALTKKGNYTDADKYLLAGLKLSQKLGLKRVVRHAYLALVDLKVQEGKTSESFNYMKKYYDMRDSILNASKTRFIVELETRHEAEKKEQELKLLSQEKHIQTIWKNFLIAGSLLLLIAIFVIYRLQQLRNRKAKLLLTTQEKLNTNLKETNKLKSRFFANISHEFRTPLTLILAPLEEELKTRTGSGKEPLLLAKRNANRLLELVNQLLDLSKLEAGKMELHIENTDIVSFLRVLAASFDSWAQHKQIDFVQHIEIPAHAVWYDKDKVEKIITNLLANAFKFTPAHGTVTFTATIHRNNDTKNILALTVADTGKGIPPEEQTQVFSSFYQTKQTIDGHEGGTGLGLSLVKELVKLYGGTITLKSAVSKGTTISVQLPTDKDAFSAEQLLENDGTQTAPEIVQASANSGFAEEESLEDKPYAEGKDSVLVVEDNVDLRNFISSALSQDFTVLTARDGKEALALAFNMMPDLVLTDLMMPTMDGIQLTEKLKADERTSHIPVILLTAKNEHQSRLEGLKTGADDYLTKPFSTEELLVRMTNLIRQRKHLAERFRERTLVPVTTTQELSLDDKFLQKVREVVVDNMSDPSFTVEKLADAVHLNRTQLLRKLKALTGLTPNDFIKDLRLQKAADLIRQKADTITQIGYAVGFNDQSYFTKCFKKQYGKTPSEFAEASHP